jgi:hypothetical protein
MSEIKNTLFQAMASGRFISSWYTNCNSVTDDIILRVPMKFIRDFYISTVSNRVTLANVANRSCELLDAARRNTGALEDIFPLHNHVYFIIVIYISVLSLIFIFLYLLYSLCVCLLPILAVTDTTTISFKRIISSMLLLILSLLLLPLLFYCLVLNFSSV